MTEKKTDVTPEALAEEDLDAVAGGATTAGTGSEASRTLKDGTRKLLDARGNLTQLNTNQAG